MAGSAPFTAEANSSHLVFCQMLIDTHAHLYLDRFSEDLDAVLDRARAAGVGAIILPAIDVPSIHRAIDLCRSRPGLYAMAALHPSETKEATEEDFEAVERLCDDEHVVAVGESGLDYYWDRSFDERQQDAFRWHIRLAAARGLPLILHNREATDDLLRILREERGRLPEPARLRGIWHCFTGTADEARMAGELGFLVGLGGILTFKNGGLGEVAAELPLEQIVLETDAPFLAPVPYRGKRNEPAYVRQVAEQLASIRGLPIEEIEALTTENARRLFDV